ncbi:DUF819 family protein [Bythopirellula goksoeyrii]|uniref:DUF819 domain-containing protein n=1 Tax=Bythopirellula goksoeyrii TaxID=1400387 RepID=A0A5B9Q4H9_9BACT|nr:DUF819 family protein [Bythopirellula goksoeyrii]QEG33928.1 hypothetical protein Pr1d_11990 [Bythopirellula goksoeyrii]
MNSLISPDNTWALWAVIIVGTTTAIWLEQSYKWAAKLSGPVLALVLAMVLSNIGVMPTEAPSYAFVGDFLVPLAIPLLLLRANLFQIAEQTGWMFVAFHISILGTVLGAALATVLLQGNIDHIAEIAGIMTASYSGGGVNFFAVRESFGVSENLTNPLLVADNFIMAGMILVLLAIAGSSWFRRYYPAPHSSESNDQSIGTTASEHWQPKPIGLLDIAKCFAIALSVVACAHQLHRIVVSNFNPSIATSIFGNMFVLVTFFSMLVATCFHRLLEKINGADELGSFMLYVFLFAIGLPADILTVLRNVPLLFLFCLIMALTNLTVTLILGKLLKIDLEELLICVSATLGGPPTAVALAIAKGWTNLIVPALLVGIWGYVVGTFLGVLVGELMLKIV